MWESVYISTYTEPRREKCPPNDFCVYALSSWSQSACRRLEVLNWHSLRQVQKLMVRITVMSYSVRTVCRPSVPWTEKRKHFSRTILQLTQRATQWSICLDIYHTPAFIPPWLWPPNSPDLTPVDYEVWSMLQRQLSRPRINSVVWTILSSVFSKNGNTSSQNHRASCSKNYGVFDCMRVFMKPRSLWAQVAVLWITVPYWKLHFYGTDMWTFVSEKLCKEDCWNLRHRWQLNCSCCRKKYNAIFELHRFVIPRHFYWDAVCRCERFKSGDWKSENCWRQHC